MMMRASDRLRRVKRVSLELLVPLGLVLGTVACGPDKPPAPPPPAPVLATGDGNEVGGYFGASGGQIRLSADGPSIIIPNDPKRAQGLALGLKRESAAALSGVTALGVTFRPTAGFEPPSGTFIRVWSSSLPALAAPCSQENLELAVQEAAQVGPADGVSSPALSWTYVKARWEESHVVAELPKLAPYPLQFVCARSASGGGT
jgi:hypothetical protein